VPSAKGKNSQVKRLQALARRVEFLWDLVQQRLAISEREIRRDIAVWGAEDLPPVSEAVPRERILADLTAPGTPYWRLKTLMDVWCALWFWPLDKVGLLDGTDPAYPATPVEVTHVREVPAYDDPAVYEKVSLWDEVMPQQGKLPLKQTGTRKVSVAEQLRQQVPLRNLDDWLTFAEALVGTADFPSESLMGQFSTLDELRVYEDSLIGPMGMMPTHLMGERFPCLPAAVDIAEQQGFFHWELTFTQAFAKGGFDLQVGNPPWVRPRWLEDGVLAEHEPWFRLADKPPVEQWRARKSGLLASGVVRADFLVQLSNNAGMVAILTHAGAFPLLAGTQPDLYRAMACQVWSHLRPAGTAGLVHPDTHFGGTKEGALREAAYRRLRVHGGFVNVANWAFDDASRNVEFGVHIYGQPRVISFLHLSRLFGARVLPESLEHNGDGPVPGQRFNGGWDVRPHRARVVEVDLEVLKLWQRLRGEPRSLPERAALLHPISTQEERAIAALASVDLRLGDAEVWISPGYHEGNAKKDGLIRWQQGRPKALAGLVVQGPHFSIATPFAKEPRIPYRSNNDWSVLDSMELAPNFIPGANYVLSKSEEQNRAGQDLWVGTRYTDKYRVAWREMIAFNTERSLFAALLPPGPSHVNAVRSMSLSTEAETGLVAGFWASLPLDYLLRITNRGHLDAGDAKTMPAPDIHHPLGPALLLRTLRLNCLTLQYGSLWARLYNPVFEQEAWALDWPSVRQLSSATEEWSTETPLRTEGERRAALVEIDALVAVWLGVGIEELISILRSRYPILVERESCMWFDSNGRKIAEDSYTFGHGQTKEQYQKLLEYQGDPERNSVPEGYEAPFYKADRENEYRQAHAMFSNRLQDAIDAGWQSS
jgi:hypothetical protein